MRATSRSRRRRGAVQNGTDALHRSDKNVEDITRTIKGKGNKLFLISRVG